MQCLLCFFFPSYKFNFTGGLTCLPERVTVTGLGLVGGSTGLRDVEVLVSGGFTSLAVVCVMGIRSRRFLLNDVPASVSTTRIVVEVSSERPVLSYPEPTLVVLATIRLVFLCSLSLSFASRSPTTSRSRIISSRSVPYSQYSTRQYNAVIKDSTASSSP